MSSAMIESLASELQPRELQLTIPAEVTDLLHSAERELKAQAATTEHGTWGYFVDRADEGPKLPACAAFAGAWPEIDMGIGLMKFSWLRYARAALPTRPSYHLDADAGTGVAGTVGETGVPEAKVWRLLANLNAFSSRHFHYLDVDAAQLEWQQEQGYINLAAGQDSIVLATEHEMRIRRRVGQEVATVLACVSRVPHAGREIGTGHFLASWSLEEPS